MSSCDCLIDLSLSLLLLGGAPSDLEARGRGYTRCPRGWSPILRNRPPFAFPLASQRAPWISAVNEKMSIAVNRSSCDEVCLYSFCISFIFRRKEALNSTNLRHVLVVLCMIELSEQNDPHWMPYIRATPDPSPLPLVRSFSIFHHDW